MLDNGGCEIFSYFFLGYLRIGINGNLEHGITGERGGEGE